MPALKDSTRRVRELITGAGLTIDDLPLVLGKSATSIRDVLNGARTTRPIRQAITDLIGVEFWPGVKPKPLTLRINLPIGTVITLPQPGYAATIAHHFGAESASVAGEIVFPAPVWIHLEKPAEPRAKSVSPHPANAH